MSIEEKLARRARIQQAVTQTVAPTPAPSSAIDKPIADRRMLLRSVTAQAPKAPPPGSIEQKLNDRRRDADPKRFAEIDRICGLALESLLAPEEKAVFDETRILAKAREAGFTLFDVQAGAIYAWERYNGLFAPIGVGWGKTLITLMAAQSSWTRGKRKILLLVPANVYLQLVERDIPMARTKVPLSVPFNRMGGKSMSHRIAMAKSGRPGCYILPYSMLSTKDSTELLEGIRPDVVICDEAHYLKNRNAARTKRLMHLIDALQPEVAVLSGTITDKSIRDYHHLIRVALRDNCPLPLSAIMANDWASVLDSTADPSATQTGPLVPLLDWAVLNFPDDTIPMGVPGFRQAYKRRLQTAPGVIGTSDQEIGCSLIFHNQPVEGREARPGWETLRKLDDDVVKLWVTPNGDEIEHAIHTYKWRFELSAGFYNQLIWPTADELAERRSIPVGTAEKLLDRAKEHHGLSQEYARLLRAWLDRHSRNGLDTPLLVASNMAQHGATYVGAELHSAWKRMHDADFPERPERDSSAVRVCDYKVAAAVEWAKSLPNDAPGGIVWWWHQEMGAWVHEALVAAGVDALLCEAGDVGTQRILDHGNVGKIMVASINGHGTGKNLQHFRNQIFLQWPRNCKIAEQTLGRLHRNGQEADEIVVELMNTTGFDAENFAATLNDAIYVQQTTGNRQKLIYGRHDPLPTIIPSHVLRERGFQNRALDVNQARALEERFGKGIAESAGDE